MLNRDRCECYSWDAKCDGGLHRKSLYCLYTNSAPKSERNWTPGCADELPEDRFHSHGILEPESQAAQYRIAAGGAAATNAGLAFNVVAALANDAGTAVARRMQSLDFRGDDAAREKHAADARCCFL